MSDLRTAAQQMLEALEGGADSWQLVGPAIDALKEALVEDAMQKFTDVNQEIEAALAEPPVDDPHRDHWVAIAEAAQKIAASKECGPAEAASFCAAIERLGAALAEPFSPEAISTTQTAWKMGYEARKAEEQAEPEPPPEAQTEAEKIAYCAGWWAALEKARTAEPVQEPVAWTLTKTLTKRETTTNGYLWFSDPVNSSWTPLYTAPPQRTPLPVSDIVTMYDERPMGDSDMIEFARAVERAHGIKE